MKKVQVGIIGAGPAGLTLGLMLQKHGISCVILENRSREYVESRVRAGLLEQNTVDLYRELGVANRLDAEGLTHHGVYLSFNGKRIRVPFSELTGGRCITIYGQQEVVKDLIKANLERGNQIIFEAEATRLEGTEGKTPKIYYKSTHNDFGFRMSDVGDTQTEIRNLTSEIENTEGSSKSEIRHHISEIECDFVAACDGYHGIGRKYLPKDSYNEFRVDYPYSWLGILAHVAPSSDELIYAYHENGFALHSLRSETVSRLYLQVDNDDKIENWTDEQIWDELELRLSDNKNFTLNRGEIFEKGITPMRSFMIDNMQHGRLFLAGDAAHIVPPTGGKGLNLAVADVRILSKAVIHYFETGEENWLETYSEDALRRIWRAQDFSNFMTDLFHKKAEHGSFVNKIQQAKFDYIGISTASATTIAENYVGLKEI